MGQRLKLLLPALLVFILFSTALHVIWGPELVDRARQSAISREKDILKSLTPGLIRQLLAGDLAALHRNLDAQLEINRDDGWRGLTLINSEGRRLYPLEALEIPVGEETIDLERSLELEGVTLGVLRLRIDLGPGLREDKLWVRDLEWLVLLLYLLLGMVGAWWQGQRETAERKLQKAYGDVEAQVVERTRDLEREKAGLRESEQRFKSLFDAMGDGVAIYDPVDDGGDFVFKDFNKAAEKINGATREEVLGRRVTEVFPGVKSFGLFDVFQQVHRTGEPVSHPITLYEDDRISGWRENYVYRLDSGEIVAVHDDVTQRRRAEERLNQYASIVAASQDHMSFVDRNFIYRAVNDAYLRAHGKERSEIVGRPVVELLGETLFDKIRPSLESCLEGESVNFQVWVDFPGTGRCWMDVSYFPQFLADGSVGGVVVAARDMTERKRMEDALRASEEEARLANRAKGEFLANMSHEIRTPMNTITGMGYLALQTELSDKQRDYLTRIDGAAKSLLRIIDDILDFSKIEAGKLALEEVTFNLDEVLNRLADSVLVKAEEKGIEVLFSFLPSIPRWLVGDPIRLGQVLFNLGSNAVKFTERGEIVFTVELEEAGPEHVVLGFSVRDTGIGMSPEEIDGIFEAFRQADASTTRKYGGAGLGLSICRDLVGLMGGEIRLESEPGRGSEVFFTARFGLGNVHREEGFMVPEALQGLRVLVVDDNPASREILRAQLSALGFHNEAAASGQEAIAELKRAVDQGETPYELVLMDWRMPGLNGMETAIIISQDKGITSFPAIIMVSALSREEVMERAGEAEIAGFIHKPVTVSSLFDAILAGFGDREEKTKTAAEPEPKSLEGVGRGARLLLVEDVPTNREVAVQILERRGFLVAEAVNGREAVKAVMEASPPFDGVIMDIQMPIMDGYEATELIRRQPALKNLPIIAMTASAMAQEVEKCLAVGMNDHVAKPIDVERLMTVLNHWVIPKGAQESEEVEAFIPEPAPVEPLIEKASLPDELPGIDRALGLEVCGNNPKLFARLLRNAPGEFSGMAAAIKGAAVREEWDEARQLAHGLKGAAGNLAATALSAVAAELEMLFSAGEDPAAALVRMEVELENLYASARNLEAMDGPARATGADLEGLLPLLKALTGFLEKKDLRAGGHFDLVRERLAGRNDFQVPLRELGVRIDRLDHPGAMAPLKRIIDLVERNGG